MNSFKEKLIVPAAFFVLGLAMSVPARADPVVKEIFHYYKIKGKTSADLVQALGRQGKVFSGAAFDARTQWKVLWKFRFDPLANGCGIRRAKTFLYLIFTLPQWSSEEKADQDLRERWKNYLEALIRHEQGHKVRGVQAAAVIEKELLGLAPAANCREMEVRANQTARRVFDTYNEEQRRYDEETDHGKKQGAGFL